MSKEKTNKMLFFLTVVLVAWSPFLISAWNKDIPAATTSLRTSNPQLLANFAALETAIGANHEFSTGGTNSGKHTTIVMEEQSSITTGANEMGLYCADLGTAPGIYVRPQSNGTAIQWTGVDAKILSAATDMLDEDDMASDSATITASQQSVKAFVTSGTVTMTNKTLTAPTITSGVLNTAVSGTAVLDEDDMASDSATQVATQQSIKAYVDAQDADCIGAGVSKSVSTNYTAATSGILVVRIRITGATGETYHATICSDDNATPTTVVAKSGIVDNGGGYLNGNRWYFTLTAPIVNGKKYRVNATGGVLVSSIIFYPND